MKCPKCVKSGEKSKVFVGASTVTCAFYQPFYDEQGNYHHHDNNVTSTDYHCSNGHRWSEKTKSSCPTCGDKWIR